MTVEIIPLFSTPLYINSIQNDEEALSFVKQLEYKKGKFSKHINTDFYILERPELYNMKEQIKYYIDNFLKQTLHFTNDIDFKIQNSWLIKHEKGEYSPMHRHKNSLYSGVVYLQVCNSSGDIVFWDTVDSPLYPNELSIEVKKYNIYNSRNWTIRPEVNNILIFPSHLHHEVTVNNSDMDRYVLAFNVFPAGILNKTGLSELRLL